MISEDLGRVAKTLQAYSVHESARPSPSFMEMTAQRIGELARQVEHLETSARPEDLTEPLGGLTEEERRALENHAVSGADAAEKCRVVSLSEARQTRKAGQP